MKQLKLRRALRLRRLPTDLLHRVEFRPALPPPRSRFLHPSLKRRDNRTKKTKKTNRKTEIRTITTGTTITLTAITVTAATEITTETITETITAITIPTTSV